MGDGEWSEKQGVGEVVVRGPLSTQRSDRLEETVVPILKLLKFQNHISLCPLPLMDPRSCLSVS